MASDRRIYTAVYPCLNFGRSIFRHWIDDSRHTAKLGKSFFGRAKATESALLGSAVKPLWRLLESQNVDANVLFTRLGLDPALLKEPRARYTYDLVCKAGIEASKVLDDPHAGLQIGEHFTPLDFNALGVTFLSSGNLLEALQRLDRYETLLNSRLDFTVVQHEDHVELTATVDGMISEAARYIENTRASVTINLARMALGKEFNPRSIAFTYPEPTDLQHHIDLLSCPLAFLRVNPASHSTLQILTARSLPQTANWQSAMMYF